MGKTRTWYPMYAAAVGLGLLFGSVAGPSLLDGSALVRDHKHENQCDAEHRCRTGGAECDHTFFTGDGCYWGMGGIGPCVMCDE